MFNLEQNATYQNDLAAAQAAWDNAATEDERAAISQDWENKKQVYQYHSNTYNSQFEGAEGPGISDELAWDQMQYNLPLIESLKRSYGDMPAEDLIDQWMYDQRFMNNNLANLGLNSALISGMNEQQKKDFALQMLTYDNVAATGEGSAPAWEQLAESTWGVLWDPATYVGLSTFGIGLLGKEGIKQTGKAGIKEALKDLFVKPTIKRGAAIGATEGAVYTTAYDSLKQSAEIQTALQEDFDWGRAGNAAMLGAAIGGTLGSIFTAIPTAIASKLEKIRIENNYDNAQMVRLIEEAGNDPVKAEELLVGAGYTREDAAKLLDKHSEVQIRRAADEPLTPSDYAADKVKEESFFQGTVGQLASSFQRRLEKIGLGKFANDINDTIIRKEQIQGNYASTIDKYSKKVKLDDPKIADRYRNNKPLTREEGDFFRELRKQDNERIEAAYRSGAIGTDTYKIFKANQGYIGRVWNTPYLRTEKGAKELADYLNSKARSGRDGMKAANDLIEGLTGQKGYFKKPADILSTGFIRKAMQNKERDVRRSTHLDFERSVKGLPEAELDKFMMPFEARMKLVNSDIANRVAFSEKFGGKDEKVVDLLNQLRNRGMADEANLVNEAYGIAARVPKTETNDFGSSALAARLKDPKVSRLVEGANAMQTWKMYLSALPNFPQAFINSFAALSSTGMARAALNTFRGPMKALMRDPDTLRIIQQSGILSELQLQKFITEGMPTARILDIDLKGPLGVLNEPTRFLRMVGFMGVEKMNRMIAASTGITHARGLHAKYQRLLNDPNRGKLKQMRINKLKKDLNELGVKNPDDPNLSDATLSYVANKFNNVVNFTNEYHNIPRAFQGPLGKLIFKFKSFMFNHGRFVKNKVIAPLRKGDPRPLMAYLGTAAPLGGAVLQLRETLTGSDYQENRDQLEWLAYGVAYAGGAGLWLDMVMSLSKPFQNPAMTASTLLGPTVGQGVSLLGTTAQIADKDLDETIQKYIDTLLPPAKPITKLMF